MIFKVQEIELGYKADKFLILYLIKEMITAFKGKYNYYKRTKINFFPF